MLARNAEAALAGAGQGTDEAMAESFDPGETDEAARL
jgi:hypothetical protein